MELLPVYDRSYNGNLANFLEMQETVKRKLHQSYKTRGETSIGRPELRKRVIKHLNSMDNFLLLEEQVNSYDDYWYGAIKLVDGFIHFTSFGTSWYCTVFTQDIETAEKYAESFDNIIPKPEPPKKDHVNFDFFMHSPEGAVKNTRSLMAPSWHEIDGNYQSDTRRQIQNLIDLKPDNIGEGGKLILLHGAPGLGKSYAIRALMKDVQSWARPSYLIDPEKFFAIPTYMYDIILNNESGNAGDINRWRLIIAEDSDEFIRADAKERTGQGLSRLLNLADGILGQGLKVIFLLTTNEPLKNLHPAVIRPGRCIANIEFKNFDLGEAREWMDSNNGGWSERLEVKNRYSLAELFDAMRSHQQIKQEKIVATTGQYL